MRDAGVAPGDLVVDVGAGSGMLTRPVLRAGARVRAVEPDAQLAGRLRRACPEATVQQLDARTLDWPGAPFRVVANLPFAHGTEILRILLSDPALPLVSADVIVEWDAAAKRARLWPGTMLAALWGAWYEVGIARRIASVAFAPPPPVAAAVLRATRREHPLVDPSRAAEYASFLQRSFGTGRLPPSAAGLAPELGIDPRGSPRDLGPGDWAALWQETSARARTVRGMSRRRSHG